MNPDEVSKAREICTDQGVPFFFKQWGGKRKGKNGRVLDGRTWDEMPTPMRRVRMTASPIPTQAHIPGDFGLTNPECMQFDAAPL